jgi:methylglutaconyl-CoA hydratase
MMSDIILFEKALTGVATITLNRPEIHNAFDEHMISGLSKLFDQINDDSEIKAVVIRGNGKSFSAGADLGWMRRAAEFSHEENQKDACALAEMLNKFYNLKALTIATIQGAAMGGGFGLASCCDIVIADANVTFALSEVNLGIIPATISPFVISAIGARQAKRYMQTGERFKGHQAQKIGLVHEVVDGDEERETCLAKILKNVGTSAPFAMSEAKRLVKDFAGKEITPQLREDSAERIAFVRTGDEAKEGLTAFFEKRKANWVKD